MSADVPTLSDRLLTLRRGALAQLAQSDRADAGILELIAHAGAVLAVIDAEAAEAVPGDRALVVDDNMQIQIVVYSADRQAAAAVLSPLAAVRLAQKLLAAAVPKLGPGVR